MNSNIDHSYLDNLDRVTASNYIPTEEDLQHSHVITTNGIKQYCFSSTGKPTSFHYKSV